MNRALTNALRQVAAGQWILCPTSGPYHPSPRRGKAWGAAAATTQDTRININWLDPPNHHTKLIVFCKPLGFFYKPLRFFLDINDYIND